MLRIMKRGIRYRLRVSTIAIAQAKAGAQQVAVVIPPDSLVEVVETAPAHEGMIPVQWDGKPCLIFKEDLTARGERLEDARLPF